MQRVILGHPRLHLRNFLIDNFLNVSVGRSIGHDQVVAMTTVRHHTDGVAGGVVQGSPWSEIRGDGLLPPGVILTDFALLAT